MNRPVGVTIIAALQLIGGLLILTGSLGTLFFRDAIAQEFSQSPELAQQQAFISNFGIFLLVIGLVNLLLAFGLFQLKAWAWLGELILQGLRVLSNLPTIFSEADHQGAAVFQIALSAAVVYYLLRPGVKQVFGQGKIDQGKIDQGKTRSDGVDS